MKASPQLANFALIGPVLSVAILLSTVGFGGSVPFFAGFTLALVLFLAVLGAVACAHWEMTVPEQTRWASPNAVFSIMPLVLLVMAVPALLLAAVLTVVLRQWALLPFLLVSCVALVLAFVHRRRERLDVRAAVAEHRPAVPKIVGLSAPEQVPPGWVPLVLYRPSGLLRDTAVDYRVHVDGDRVGTIAPGATLVVGVPPGPHRVRLHYGRYTSPAVPFTADAGEQVRLWARPGGEPQRAAIDQWTRPSEYLGLTPAPTAPAPEPEPRSGRWRP
ncbi:hypothetical protein [Nocardiopsis protaetiae]|uniref:hypothetical protein n=1 Tax=Nocardiopsis protaetiae TaxID=3382270 RepID=UPI00387B7A00